MQDIVFYAAANETLGIVRDYANARNQAAPVLVLGVSVCLRIRLFAACGMATPYPVSAFNGIVDWQWNMDADFDRSTTCKLAADADSISVHSVTDTVNGETLNFTEFVIPISNMNTQELAAWLGNEKKRAGLNGELVGYDSAGNAAFVLQIENFTVRNRVAGLGDPTALDQGIVTHSIAETMIQSAVSASAGTKQDKLTAANAGTGIAIDSAGTINTAAVPQSAITGLSASLAAKQDNLTAGYRMAIVSGSTVEQSRWFPIESPAESTVTLLAGHAYKLNATASYKTLNAETVPDNSFGLEGHLEVFVAGTGFVKTGSNVILSQPLEPDSINYCTVRFRSGMAIISVEDHIGGYIVVSATGTTAGTLLYGLTSAGSQYIAFNDTLAGLAIDMGGAVTSGEKHVVGNGYADTILTGGVSCTSKTTFANLTMSGVVNSGGTMTLGDVNVESVSIAGGALAVEKATGNGGRIDLGGTNIMAPWSASAYANGITFVNAASGGAVYVSNGKATVESCIISGTSVTGEIAGLSVRGGGGSLAIISSLITGNTAANYTGVYNWGQYALISGSTVTENRATGINGGVYMFRAGLTEIKDSVISGNIASTAIGADIMIVSGGTVALLGGNTVGHCAVNRGGIITFAGSNRIDVIEPRSAGASGSVTISSGAVVDLTGNTHTTTINPGGGGMTFAPGGATVYPSAGSASAYSLGGVTVPQIGNTNMIDIGGTTAFIDMKDGSEITGATITGYAETANNARGVINMGWTPGSALMSSCTITGNTHTNGLGGAVNVFTNTSHSACELTLSDCVISGNAGPNPICVYGGGQDAVLVLKDTVAAEDAVVGSGGKIVLDGAVTVKKIANYWQTSDGVVIIGSGAIVDLTGNTNSTPIAPGGSVVMPARPEDASVQFHYTDPDAPLQDGHATREFNELEIHGTTVTNLGIIYGATVTVPADTQDIWIVNTTEGTVELTSASAGDYVVSGGLTGIEKS
ncbi:MAG: hypothetical protein IKQ16_00340 [Lentisphaeria bacterium]|nr:hypothetical protein [Lentisphaeria bacterium]